MSLLIIGIAGASGAGKSSLAQGICADLNRGRDRPLAAVLHEDSYYRARPGLSMEEKNRINYDHPDAFEHELLHRHLQQFERGETVHVPVYDYSIHDRSDQTIEMSPPDVLLIEGILVLHDEIITRHLNLAIFVEAPLAICLQRRIDRDTRDRGRSRESVLRQFQQTVRPMYHTFIHPSRWNADIIVPSHRNNDRARLVITSWIRQAAESPSWMEPADRPSA